MDKAYTILFTAALVILGIGLFVCLLRAVRGPSAADRVLSINMIGTITIALIAVISVLMDQGYLMDVAILYALLSFLSVVILSKIYVGIYRARREREGKSND